MKEKKRVYICSPYRGAVEQNTLVAQALCRRAVAQGAAPYAPHLYLPGVFRDDDPVERTVGMAVGLEFLRACHEIWVYTPAGISEGMKCEIEVAGKLGIRRIAITQPVLTTERFRMAVNWLSKKERETYREKTQN